MLSSRKGVETTPLLILFSAVALIMALGIFYPALQDWQDMMDRGKAVKEASRLADAINEIHAMGDYGSVQTIEISMPAGYYIDVQDTYLQVIKESDGNEVTRYDLNAKITKNTINQGINGRGQRAGEIFAGDKPVTLVIAYWDPNSPNPLTAPYQILIQD